MHLIFYNIIIITVHSIRLHKWSVSNFGKIYGNYLPSYYELHIHIYICTYLSSGDFKEINFNLFTWHRERIYFGDRKIEQVEHSHQFHYTFFILIFFFWLGFLSTVCWFVFLIFYICSLLQFAAHKIN